MQSIYNKLSLQLKENVFYFFEILMEKAHRDTLPREVKKIRDINS